MKEFGNPPFPQLRYCVRCCMPETNEGMQFDELGICLACRSSEVKMHINWVDRKQALSKIIDSYRNDSGYDCIVPISGGKDSTFQLHVLTKLYKVKPLVVTFNHNWYTPVGAQNLFNTLEMMDVDHIMFTPHRTLVNRLARKSIHKVGDACWHCHIGVEAFPLQVAVKWRIPLIIYGESPAEHSGRASYDTPTKFDHDFFVQHSAKCTPDAMVGEEFGCNIEKRDLCPFYSPSVAELEDVGVCRIFLGDYMFWDAERQTEFIIKEYGWQEADVDGTYKRYKSVECKMPGMHDYTKFLKRGFGRGTDFANQDVRTGLMTREEGFELAKKYDQKRPDVMDHFLEITGLTEDELVSACKRLRKGKAKQLP